MTRTLPFAIALAWSLVAVPAARAAIPGVDLAGIAPGDVEQLEKLLAEGACPCAPARSLLDCARDSSCPAATELAVYGAARVREGLSAEQVREAVVKKYIADNVKYELDLSHAPHKGAANGRIVVVEFADFECPHCAALRPVLEHIVELYPEDVTLYFKQFPLPGHPNAEAASRATWAAGRQDRFWQMHDLIFQNQARLERGRFAEFAQELGLNVEKFKADMESPAAYAYVQADLGEAQRAQLTGTPGLFVNNRLYLEAKTEEAIKAYIDVILKRPAKPPEPAPRDPPQALSLVQRGDVIPSASIQLTTAR